MPPISSPYIPAHYNGLLHSGWDEVELEDGRILAQDPILLRSVPRIISQRLQESSPVPWIGSPLLRPLQPN